MSEPIAATTSNPLAIDCALVESLLIGFVKDEVERTGLGRVVFGLSGGIDSTLSAYIAVKALGPENVCGIRMPYSQSSAETMEHGTLIADRLGIEMKTVAITDQIDAYFRNFPDASRLRRANKMARERMTILYDHSADQKALVLGTSNKTELLIGYGTIFGDMASALNPIGDLYKTQVWALSEHMGVPESVVKKQPTADLWAGQTDESELGFTYGEIDRLLVRMVDERARPPELEADGFDPAFIRRVGSLLKSSQYKRRMPLIAKVSHRTIEHDFRYSRDWGT
jgi:NAD+ synthase